MLCCTFLFKNHNIFYILIIISPQDPPGPPSAPEPSDVTKESCSLTWTAPESDGGSPVTGYFIERSTTQSTRWLRVNKQPEPETTYEMTELIEDTEYEFRIVAVNKVGEGPPGPKSTPVKAKDPWGKCQGCYCQLPYCYSSYRYSLVFCFLSVICRNK